MLFVVSPAKNLDYDTPAPTSKSTQPRMLDDAEKLVQRAKELSPQQLASLMKISDKLAGLNAARFSEWHQPFTTENAKQAVFAFNGDVYAGLEATTLSPQALEYAQGHMRILSGLYGVLRPLDLIQAYRLEMGIKLENPQGKDLYAYWGDRITKLLNKDIRANKDEILVNLASNEYFKAVQASKIEAKLITPVFKDTKNGQLKIISFYAKKARGLMARFILEKQPQNVDDLKGFASAGYKYDNSLSSDAEIVFTRPEQV